MSIPLPPPEPTITIQCDAKPACTGLQFAVACPVGYYPAPLSQLTVRHAEIDYYRKIRDVLTTSCIKKPPEKKRRRAKGNVLTGGGFGAWHTYPIKKSTQR